MEVTERLFVPVQKFILFRNFSNDSNFFDSATTQVLEASHVEGAKPNASHNKEKQTENCFHIMLAS